MAIVTGAGAAGFAKVDPRLLAQKEFASGGKTLAQGLTGLVDGIFKGIDAANKSKLASAKAASANKQMGNAIVNNRSNITKGKKSIINRPADDPTSFQDDIYVDSKGGVIQIQADKDGSPIIPDGARRVDLDGAGALYRPDFQKLYANPTKRRAARKTWRGNKRDYLKGRNEELKVEGEDGINAIADSVRLGDLSRRDRRRIFESLGGASDQEQLLTGAIASLSDGPGISRASKNYNFFNAYNSNPKSLTRIIEQDGSVTFKVMDGNTGEYYGVEAGTLSTTKDSKGKVSIVGFNDTNDLKLVPSEFNEMITKESDKFSGDQKEYKAYLKLMEDNNFKTRALEMLHDNAGNFLERHPEYDANKDGDLSLEEAGAVQANDLWDWNQGINQGIEQEGGLINAEEHTLKFLDVVTQLRDFKDAGEGGIAPLLSQLKALTGEENITYDAEKFEIKIGDEKTARTFNINSIDGINDLTIEGAKEAGLDQTTIEQILPYLQGAAADRIRTEGAKTFSDGDGAYDANVFLGDLGSGVDLIKEFRKTAVGDIDAITSPTGFGVAGKFKASPLIRKNKEAFLWFKLQEEQGVENPSIPRILLDPNASKQDKTRAFRELTDKTSDGGDEGLTYALDGLNLSSETRQVVEAAFDGIDFSDSTLVEKTIDNLDINRAERKQIREGLREAADDLSEKDNDDLISQALGGTLETSESETGPVTPSSSLGNSLVNAKKAYFGKGNKWYAWGKPETEENVIDPHSVFQAPASKPSQATPDTQLDSKGNQIVGGRKANQLDYPSNRPAVPSVNEITPGGAVSEQQIPTGENLPKVNLINNIQALDIPVRQKDEAVTAIKALDTVKFTVPTIRTAIANLDIPAPAKVEILKSYGIDASETEADITPNSPVFELEKSIAHSEGRIEQLKADKKNQKIIDLEGYYLRKDKDRLAYESKAITKKLEVETKAIKKEVVKSVPYEANTVGRSFIAAKGNLRLPVSDGLIISKFGVQPHHTVKTVKVNNSTVTIASPIGSDASSVFDGKVLSVLNYRGGKPTVLVQHGDYITSYTGLENVTVKKGDIIKKGDSLGGVFTNKKLDTTELRFGVFHKNKAIDPIQWLNQQN